MTIINLLMLMFLGLLNLFPSSAKSETRVEFRSAAFFHTSKLFREIYGKVGPDFQIQASTDLCDCWELWTNADWFSKHGHSVGFHDPTWVKIINYTLGINFVYPLCQHAWYIGAGPCFGLIWLKNKPRCEIEKTKKGVFGGILKTGLYLSLTDCLFLDLFVDYLYQPVHFQHHVDIGGIKPGIGIGMVF